MHRCVAAAVVIPAAHAQTRLGPCTLFTPDPIEAVLNSPVEPGQPGVAKGSDECTWSDAQGEDRVYIALRPAADFRTTRTNLEKSGVHPTPVTGLGDDAFFVSPDDSSSALYVLTKTPLLLLTVTLPNATQEQNQTFEQTLPPRSSPNSEGLGSRTHRVPHSYREAGSPANVLCSLGWQAGWVGYRSAEGRSEVRRTKRLNYLPSTRHVRAPGDAEPYCRFQWQAPVPSVSIISFLFRITNAFVPPVPRCICT
jgi:hypothetical protein